ncbi:hypothetical protein FRC03_012018 [Tulasnella sp. 419]|nr:hypothetical protein FRC03_012018 [Tulasnella sp. 419]
MSNSNVQNARQPYSGNETNLVISIDFGTTFSGTSWALLEPHNVPKIFDVSGFEGQEFEATSTKVPTVIFYDRHGNLKAVGNETLDDEMELQARSEKWIRVEWFKLLLRPRDKHHELANAPQPTLPANKTAVDVIGDYYGYMARLAQAHFREKVPDYDEIWPLVEKRIIYVLSHPNGWNTFQHAEMRKAAVKGGLIPDTNEGKSRIHFVSEGEASLHWCISDRQLVKTEIKEDTKFVVVDAGGGTIDVSSYEVASLRPLQFREASASSSHLAGSIFVTQAFKSFVKEKFGLGTYGEAENIRRIVKEFDQKNVMLVGGFVANPWLFTELQRRLRNLNIRFHRADSGTAKAAAHGAVSFYLDHLVSARVARYTYGISACVPFDPSNSKHLSRLIHAIPDPLTGVVFLAESFAQLLNKGTVVKETELTRVPLRRHAIVRRSQEVELELRCYQGDKPDIEFLDEDDNDTFSGLCSLKATIPESCLVQQDVEGGIPLSFLPSHYYACKFDVVVTFGETELKGYLEWTDDKVGLV